ncbi:MAG: DUF423 domain-containing protein [Pirellula sp.]
MGSHSLPKRLKAQGFSETVIAQKKDQCEIAVRYQMFHTLAVLAIGLAPATPGRRGRIVACSLFMLGIVLFSGGLYSMVFLNRMWHWSIVPIGGGMWMVAWITLASGTLFPNKSIAHTGESQL